MDSNEENKESPDDESEDDEITLGQTLLKEYSYTQVNVVKTMDDEKLVIDKHLEDVFYDAYDFIPSDSIKIKKKHLEELKLNEETKEPLERSVLPYLKDPKTKISVLTILKEVIGKDLTRISLPVYLNDPTNILQRNAIQMEYNDILDEAIKLTDSAKRCGYISIYATSMFTNLAKSCAKPFNPMLGETYELVTPKYTFLAE